jgi:hypothetical protein
MVLAATFVACATSRKPVVTPAAGAPAPAATAPTAMAELPPAGLTVAGSASQHHPANAIE